MHDTFQENKFTQFTTGLYAIIDTITVLHRLGKIRSDPAQFGSLL